jgi:hypothetical protein
LDAWCGGSPGCPWRRDRAAARKQTDRRKERDGEAYKKSLGIRHFRIFRARRRFPGLPKSLGMEKIKKDFNGGGWMYNHVGREAKTEILAKSPKRKFWVKRRG